MAINSGIYWFRNTIGFLKKEIAQKLGYNRCTITEILKKYKETHANTEISGQIAKG